ncbi:uncharacterized protein LOC100280435 [Zea mays]|jgi:hypothetical protein|uniref:Uncharacterized protein n=2 Tax=Zea mays TaxID=4577 RepID=K7UXX5_MAIZE|nr:uncharacterized protein LOC100280435 [Zea mays]AQK89909.1 hypothetical protein ZEAMMB73_Zm00001d008454 [Zea mays]|eukprot:NP_001146828.2 uncharacterized protein LOC100280435 [Zea mays]
MTLLAAITNPATGSSEKAHPIVITPGATPPPPTSSALPTSIPPSAWSLSPADPAIATAASYLAASLDSCSSLPRLRILLTDFITTLSQSLALSTPAAALPATIRAVAPYFPAAISSLVASKAASLAGHDILLALAESRLLPHPPPELISSLCKKDQVDLVCALLRQAADIRSSEILAALRCFLSPASDKAYDAMIDVKGRWKDAAVLAVNRCQGKSAGKRKRVDAATRRVALLLMMGYDRFTSPEVCLHYLFASEIVDSVVLGAAVAELDGEEVIKLMRYLNMWIGKYRRFLEAHMCPEAVEMLELDQCDIVPSFGAVARALGVLLDNHFSHLVLNADAREDLRAAELIVRELTAEAESSGTILDLLHRLQLNK